MSWDVPRRMLSEGFNAPKLGFNQNEPYTSAYLMAVDSAAQLSLL